MTDTMLINNNSFDLNNKKQQHIMAPPSPQLSQDDLVRGLEVLDNKRGVHPTDSVTGLLSPVSPKHQDLFEEEEEEEEELVMVEEEYQLENDVAIMIYFEFLALIYWEIPGRSGIVLGGILSSLILTRYYSLLYVFAATITIVTGFNLIFVNAYNFIRTIWTGLPSDEFPHPYHLHIHNHRLKIVSRDLTNYYIHKFVDVLEIVAQYTDKIVYVEDTKITGLVCLLSAFTYFATSLVPTKVFLGLFVLAVFTVPYYYEQHQVIVDEKVNLILEKSKSVMDKYSTVVRRNSAIVYDYSIALVQQQLAKKSAAAATTKETTTAKVKEAQTVVVEEKKEE